MKMKEFGPSGSVSGTPHGSANAYDQTWKCPKIFR